MRESPDRRAITVHDLYPHFADAEVEAAEVRFKAYLALALRIFERLEAAGSYPQVASLTKSSCDPTLRSERSAPTGAQPTS